MSKFCPLPWMSYAIRNNGDVRVCCHANQGPNKGILFKDDDNPFRYNDSIDESRNSKTLKSIRLSILQNKWHNECLRCRREYNSGLRTRNMNETDMWKNVLTKDMAHKITEADGSINTSDIPLVYYDLRFGNVCNLRCRMCFPTDSSGWFKEYEQVYGTDTYNETVGKMKIIRDGNSYVVENSPYDWYKESVFWEELDKHKDQMQHIYIVGGEPMIVYEHYDFLDSCVNSDHAKNIKIEYNTNLTVVPDRAIEIWKNFKEVRFGVSIDGYGKVNDYIRWPSKFETIEKNLRRLDEADANYVLWIACTISVYNILYLPDFIIWKINQKFKKINSGNYHPLITVHPVHRPEFMNIKMFPKKSKDMIKELLRERIREIYKAIDESSQFPEESRAEASKIINGYIQYMYQDDYSNLIPKFWKYNNRMDEIRRCEMDYYLPGLRSLL